MGTLTEDGLVIRRFPEIVSDIEDSERANIDPNISTESNEVLGQLNNTIAEQIALQEFLGQSVYDAFNPLKAEGVNLDNLAALIGVTRIAGAPSSTDRQLCVGSDGVSVPLGTLIQNPISLDLFSFTSEVLLTTLSCYSTRYSVKELLIGVEYLISINGNDVTYTSQGGDGEQEILEGLEAYNTANFSSDPWTMTVDVANLQLVITSASEAGTLNISSITYIGSDEVSVYGSAESSVVSGIIAPSNSVTGIVSPISNWDSTTNTSNYVVGREQETDEELRARLLVSQQISGKGTVQAIQDSLTNTLGVSSATVVENELMVFSGGSNVVTFTNATNKVNWTANTLLDGEGVRFSSTINLPAEIDNGVQYWVVNRAANDFEISLTKGGSSVVFTDDGSGTQKVHIGRPSKSFEAIVQGGIDEDVGLTIWDSKPSGIESYGATVTIFNDSDGTSRTINFTRPEAVELLFEVTYEQDTEEVTPSPAEIEEVIKSVVSSETSALGLGQDVLPSKYYGPIYNQLTGIILTSIEVKRQSGGAFVSDRLAIEPDEFANVTTSNVTVIAT